MRCRRCVLLLQRYLLAASLATLVTLLLLTRSRNKSPHHRSSDRTGWDEVRVSPEHGIISDKQEYKTSHDNAASFRTASRRQAAYETLRPGDTIPSKKTAERSRHLREIRLQAVARHTPFTVSPQSNTLNIARQMKLPELAPGLWAGSVQPDEFFSDEQCATFREVFHWTETVSGACRHLRRFGGIRTAAGLIDGDKMACMDDNLSLAVAGDDCLVYSVGIQNEWSFDRAMAEHGCNVFSFDPSMETHDEGQVAPRIRFYRLGLGRNSHINVYNWTIKAWDDLLDQFGHLNRTVSYLKADAEGGEMDMLLDQTMLQPRSGRRACLDNVEQMGLEIHFRLEPEKHLRFYQEVRDAFRQLDRLGFRVVFSKTNEFVPARFVFPGVATPVSLLHEILLVKFH